MYFLWHRLMGRKVIACKREWDNEIWYSVLKTDAWGQNYAYRYPFTKVGHVTLNDDGTGYYFGEIKWKVA